MDIEKYKQLINELKTSGAQLIAVSKTKPAEDILEVYKAGQKMFGENKVQEMATKFETLPKDIEWHMIGHLQSNKVKYIAGFVSLIHSVDSLKLLQEINRQAQKNNRVINCLLQVFIAKEETKFGLSPEELSHLLQSREYLALKNIRISGLMAMASNTDDEEQINNEFAGLRSTFNHIKATHFAQDASFKELSIGMSSDYKIALKHGATLIRVGSLIFGHR